MKSLLLILVLVLMTACGKSGGGGGSQGSKVEPIRIDCTSKINRDSLIDYAVSANTARNECNLTEDQAVQFVQ